MRIAGGVVHRAHVDRPITQVIAALLVNTSDKSSDDNFDPSMFPMPFNEMMMPGISAFGDSFDNPLPPTTNFAFGFPMQFVIYMTVRCEICIVFFYSKHCRTSFLPNFNCAVFLGTARQDLPCICVQLR